jgi:hypothetical protein
MPRNSRLVFSTVLEVRLAPLGLSLERGRPSVAWLLVLKAIEF